MDLGIESVLVAGRGPAACGVTAACSRLGIKAIAVHSAAERHARHVRLADDAVELGPAPAAESYLAVDRIVEAAQRRGASAVLPGPRPAPRGPPGAGARAPSCRCRRPWPATPGWRLRSARPGCSGWARTPRCS